MKALQLSEPKRWKAIDIGGPPPPGPEDAVVRVQRVGICGTDIGGYLGKMPFFTYPRIPGHELGVEVLAVGSEVTNVKPGDRCAVEPYLNDPSSYASRRGRPNCCERLQVLGVHIDGGLRPEFLLPARKLHPAEGLSYEQAALVETLAIGRHAVQRGGPLEAESVLIVGAGPIGLAALEFVKLIGCSAIVLDRDEGRLEFCRTAMHAKHCLAPSDRLDAELRDRCGGHLPDVVIDATGNAASMAAAFGLVAPGGRLVFVGITADEVKFAHPVFHRPEGTLLCSRNALPEDFGAIIGLIRSGRIDTTPWITHRVPFAEVPEFFPQLVKPGFGAVKAMVEMP